MSRFPSAKHLASWAGVCPGNNQSAGRRLRAGIPHGSPWLRAALGAAVWAVSHTKSSYLAAQFARIARRRGTCKAVMAVAHTILVIISAVVYAVVRDHTPDTDLGPNSFDRLDQARVERHQVRRLEQLGDSVIRAPSSA
jgi:transposase